MTNEDATQAALAAMFANKDTRSEVDPIAQRSQASLLTKQYPLFTTSILCAYIQGTASPMFMQASPEDYLSAVMDNEQKEFIKPLWLILHTNKNIKFRPINPHLIPDGKESEFAAILNAFRKESQFSAFLSNYKTFLNFMASNALAIEPDKIFTDLVSLLGRIGAYREECLSAMPISETKKVILSSDDLDNLDF